MDGEFTMIRTSDLFSLVRDALELDALYAVGIDNTDAYDERERVEESEVAEAVAAYVRAAHG